MCVCAFAKLALVATRDPQLTNSYKSPQGVAIPHVYKQPNSQRELNQIL